MICAAQIKAWHRCAQRRCTALTSKRHNSWHKTPSLTPQKGGSDGLRLVRLQQGGAAAAPAPASGMVSGGDIHTALLLTCMGACGTALGGLIVVAQARLVYVLDDGVVTTWRPLCTRETSTSTLTC